MSEDTENDRGDYIRDKVRKKLDELNYDSLEWSDIPVAGFERVPLWYELRDTVTSVLFDMDRDQVEHQRHSEV